MSPMDLAPELVDLRRRLHRIPELAFQETETTELILEALDRIGIATERVPSGGIVGRIGPGRTQRIALRAELDALPGEEATGLPFRSIHPGVVHACGHDAHMAMLVGAAALLADAPPPGGVRLLFQPAEERGAGARTMAEAGALDGVGGVFAVHVSPHYATGEIMVTDGVVTAQSDAFRIDVLGKAGHAARPHEAVDAVAVAGFLVTSVYALVQREIDPVHPSVITIGRVTAGTAPNVIAGEARLEGSIRSTAPAVRTRIHAGLERLARGAAMLHDAKVTVTITSGYPAVVNTPGEAALAREAAVSVFGEDRVVAQEHPSMGSEDFSFMLEKAPGCYARLGCRKAGWDYVPLHSPGFTIDEAVLPLGARYLAEVARRAAARLAAQ